MKKLLVIFCLLFSTASYAQEYTANTWASWASITSQISWIFPSNSRTVTIMNGSNQPICVSFGTGYVMNQNCTLPLTNQGNTGNNKVFQIPGAQWLTLNNMVTKSINIMSAGTAASPVSVLVNY